MKAISNKTRAAKKGNVFYISSYKKRNVVKPYTKTDDDWYEILRAGDSNKKVSFKGSRVIGKLILELHKNNDRPIYKDNHWFSKITKVYSSKQNGRIRGQIDHIFNFEFYKRIVVDGVLLKDVYKTSFTTNAYKILNFHDIQNEQKNKEENIFVTPPNKSLDADKNVPIDGQKCPSYIDNKEIKEEEPLGYSSSFILNNEKLKIKKKQETENTTCSNAILTEHSQVAIPEPKEDVINCHILNQPKLLTAAEEKSIHLQRMQRSHNPDDEFSLVDLLTKITNKQENIGVLQLEVETIPSISPAEESIDQPKNEILSNKQNVFMKQEEQKPIPDKETRKMLLSKAIFDAFGAAANEIQDNCTFEELEPDRVGIKIALGVSFNDIEKAKIRRCIQSVYDENVKLVVAKTQLTVTTEQLVSQSGLTTSEVLVSNSCNNPQWLRFKAALTKVLLKKHEEKIAHHIVKNWFDKLRVSDDSTSQKLILIGSVFTIQWIDDKFGMELENAVLASNLTIELRDEANRNRPLIFSKETIKRG